MQFNSLVLAFVFLMLPLFTADGIRIKLVEKRVEDKCLVNLNLDRVVMDTLAQGIEGVYEDFEPILEKTRIKDCFRFFLELSFGRESMPDIPVLLLTEKNKISFYYEEEGVYAWQGEKSVKGLTQTEKTDLLREEMELIINKIKNINDKGIEYRISIPYIENEEWYQNIKNTGLWLFYQSPAEQIAERNYFYFVCSGSEIRRISSSSSSGSER